MRTSTIEAKGIEHDSVFQTSTLHEASGIALSDVTRKSSEFSHTATHLERISQAWPSLPPHIQEAILTLVDTVWKPASFEYDQLSRRVANKKFIDPTITSDELRRVLLKALRHTPDSLSLKIDADGWVDILGLKEALTELTQIPSNLSDEGLFRLLSDLNHRDQFQIQSGRIRAAYGHSFTGFDPSSEAIPDLPLFHGTDTRHWPSIDAYGLSPQKRSFVQLTTDFDYAEKIATSRNRKPLILQIMTSEAVHCGVRFYRTGTHVWLSTGIPSECLQIWNTEPFDIDDWNIESHESREPECDLLRHTPELGDIADAKNH